MIDDLGGRVAVVRDPDLPNLAAGDRDDHDIRGRTRLVCPIVQHEGAFRVVKPFAPTQRKIIDVLDSLTERERRVLSLRFGLIDGYSRTLEEVGKQFKVTRERIRQIEAKALRKMRHPTRIRQLQGFLENEELEVGV